MVSLPDLATLTVYDIAIFVDQVALVIDSSAHIIDCFIVIALLQDYFPIRVLVEDSNHVLDIIAFTTVI